MIHSIKNLTVKFTSRPSRFEEETWQIIINKENDIVLQSTVKLGYNELYGTTKICLL